MFDYPVFWKEAEEDESHGPMNQSSTGMSVQLQTTIFKISRGMCWVSVFTEPQLSKLGKSVFEVSIRPFDNNGYDLEIW